MYKENLSRRAHIPREDMPQSYRCCHAITTLQHAYNSKQTVQPTSLARLTCRTPLLRLPFLLIQHQPPISYLLRSFRQRDLYHPFTLHQSSPNIFTMLPPPTVGNASILYNPRYLIAIGSASDICEACFYWEGRFDYSAVNERRR